MAYKPPSHDHAHRGAGSPGARTAFLRKLDSTLAETDRMVAAATGIIASAWDAKRVDRSHPFDEPLEHHWVSQWVFYANSVRAASAMAGPDYAAFKNGWWNLHRNLQEMAEYTGVKLRSK